VSHRPIVCAPSISAEPSTPASIPEVAAGLNGVIDDLGRVVELAQLRARAPRGAGAPTRRRPRDAAGQEHDHEDEQHAEEEQGSDSGMRSQPSASIHSSGRAPSVADRGSCRARPDGTPAEPDATENHHDEHRDRGSAPTLEGWVPDCSSM
jgi:ribosomal protein L12E/L44/L45/RPP1/RPP2